MATLNGNVPRLRLWILATSLLLATGAAAQSRGVASAPDMRLWSFGDCERKYPNADSIQYQECMRVVGSPEARALRAQRLCEDSYPNDPGGVDRCMSPHRQARERGTEANADTTLSPEMTLQVQAIASAAVEQHKAAEKESAPAEAATPRAGSSLTSLVLVGALGVVLLGVGGTIVLRRQL